MDEYLELIKNASGDIWKVFKEFSNIGFHDDKNWEKLVAKTSEISKKYENTKAQNYAVKYCVLIIKELERKAKENEK